MPLLALDGAELDPQSIFIQKGKSVEGWVLQSTGFPGAGYTYTALYHMVGSPHGTILAYTGRSGGTQSVMRSTDGGVTWTDVYNGSQLSANRPVYCGSGIWMAATYGNNGARYHYSTSDGVVWTSYQALSTSASSILMYGIASNGAGRIWVHVSNPNTIRYHNITTIGVIVVLGQLFQVHRVRRLVNTTQSTTIG